MASDKKPTKRTAGADSTPFWFDALSTRKQDLVCAGILLLIVYFVFRSVVFSDMGFSDSPDNASHDSFMAGIHHLQETEHADPLWLPYIFSGMPVFAGLLFPHNVNYVETLVQLPGNLLFLKSGLSWFVLHYFLMGLFMYMLARKLGFAPLPSLLAGVTLMLHPAAISLAPEGHGSKLITLSYVPLLFLLTVNLFQKRNLLGLGLLAGVTGTLFLSRHPQVAFYGLLLIGAYVAYEFAMEVRKQPAEGVKKILLFGAALAIGFAIYSYEFLPTKEYSTYSIRGGGEEGSSKALDYDYATNWSFHPLEAFTYLVPATYGFSTDYTIELQGEEREVQFLYWGWLPFTNWPAYIGIIPLLLAFIALLYRRDKLAWFLGGFSLIVLLISFGKYFGLVYDLFFNYVPYFNKFRAPILILYLIPITFGILAAGGATYLIELTSSANNTILSKMTGRMKVWAIALAALLVIGFIGKSAMEGFLSGFMFNAPSDSQFPRDALSIVHGKRFEVFWNYFEWAAFQGAALFGLVFLYLKGHLRRSLLMFGIVALLTVDLAMIASKLIKPKPASEVVIPFKDDPTVLQLSAESDTSLFRVLPTWGLGGFDNSLMGYHLQMVTGYSPAKLKIYQETIESCFTKGNRKVFDMLNTKYYLVKQGAQGSERVAAQLNPDCLPRAWFVDSIAVSSSKGETFGIMNSESWNPRTTAILEKKPGVAVGKAAGASVTSFQFGSEHISVGTSAPAPALLVVSEIYYPGGWKAFVDGVETEIYKTNYILRSVIVPAGNHTIEMKFAPESYEKGLLVSEGAWGVTLLLIVAGIVQLPWVKAKMKRGPGSSTPS